MIEKNIEIIARAIDIIEKIAFTKNKNISIRDLALETGYSKSSIHRILKTLIAKGFISKSFNESYTLGAKFLILKSVKNIYESYLEILAPVAAEVVESTNQTALVNVLDGDKGLCIFKHEPQTAVKFVTEIGMHIPLIAGASGKVLMAFAPEETQERIYESDLTKYARNTIIDKDELRAHIEQIKNNKLAISREEFQENAFSVSVPIFLPNEQLLSQYGIAGTAVMLDENEDFFISEVRRTAKIIQEAVNKSIKFD